MSQRAWILAASLAFAVAGCGDEDANPGRETEEAFDEAGEAVERELSGASAEVQAEAETLGEEIDDGVVDAVEAADTAGERAEQQAEEEQAELP